MGTRNITMVVSNGEMKVAQYGQWDGYPEGNGLVVFSFLKKLIRKNRLNEFKDIVNKCSYITDEKIKEYYKELGVDVETQKFITLEIANEFKKRHPQLDRDMGADILEYLLECGPEELKDDKNFVNDSLFCEWGYLIDLDNEVMEVYKGYNKEPLTEEDRFYKKTDEKLEYYPIRKIIGIPFDILAGIKKKSFLGICNWNMPKDDEEEE